MNIVCFARIVNRYFNVQKFKRFTISRMGKLPLLSAKEVATALKKLGFEFKRQQGSHMFFEHSDGRTTIIPHPPREDIDRGLLNKIVKHDLQINREEFLEALK